MGGGMGSMGGNSDPFAGLGGMGGGNSQPQQNNPMMGGMGGMQQQNQGFGNNFNPFGANPG